MRFHIMTLFPEIFNSYFGESIMKRAIEKGIIEVFVYNIRDFSANKHKKVDDYPFGGGAGMLMTPQPIYDTYKHIVDTHNIENPRVIYLTPKGKTLKQGIVKGFSKEEDIILLCGSGKNHIHQNHVNNDCFCQSAENQNRYDDDNPFQR